MLAEMRVNNPDFYKILDSLMLSNYEDCIIKDGQYILNNKHLKIDVRLRAFYFHLDPTKYTDAIKFKKNSSWRNDLLKCGLKLTASTGNTYSYPGLRDYIIVENDKDIILKASYYFACITQIVTFFSQRLNDMDFKKSELSIEE